MHKCTMLENGIIALIKWTISCYIITFRETAKHGLFNMLWIRHGIAMFLWAVIKKNNGIIQYICLRKEIEASKKLTDCLRERKERGNEKRLFCWASADECVLSHYSHTVQYAGQSGDNECSVWYLAFFPPPCSSGLLSPLYRLSFFTLVHHRIFYTI